MNIAIIGTSKREDEKRVPIHPEHIQRIPLKTRQHLVFEKGYGIPFHMEDEQIYSLTGNHLVDRARLLREYRTILITKPVVEDLESMQEGATLWGWVHSVLQTDIAQTAIDKRLTLIAWENMHYRGRRDTVHLFSRNNEMAGYCGVQHALQVVGIDGNFGPPRKVAVISLGSVSRGSIRALQGHGFYDITVYTHRPPHLSSNKIPGIQQKQIKTNDQGLIDIVEPNGGRGLFIDELKNADVIVNGVLQNPNRPELYIRDSDVADFKKPCLVIDVSCSTGMGFSFARPTDFSAPVFRIGKITYYAVDHTPTLLWNSASWVISNSIQHYLPYVVDETENKILADATDIKDGFVLNRDILTVQNRAPEYPYPIRA